MSKAIENLEKKLDKLNRRKEWMTTVTFSSGLIAGFAATVYATAVATTAATIFGGLAAAVVAFGAAVKGYTFVDDYISRKEDTIKNKISQARGERALAPAQQVTGLGLGATESQQVTGPGLGTTIYDAERVEKLAETKRDIVG